MRRFSADWATREVVKQALKNYRSYDIIRAGAELEDEMDCEADLESTSVMEADDQGIGEENNEDGDGDESEIEDEVEDDEVEDDEVEDEDEDEVEDEVDEEMHDM